MVLFTVLDFEGTETITVQAVKLYWLSGINLSKEWIEFHSG